MVGTIRHQLPCDWKWAVVLVSLNVTSTQHIGIDRKALSQLHVVLKSWCFQPMLPSTWRLLRATVISTRGMPIRWLCFSYGCNTASWLLRRIFHSPVVNQPSLLGGPWLRGCFCVTGLKKVDSVTWKAQSTGDLHSRNVDEASFLKILQRSICCLVIIQRHHKSWRGKNIITHYTIIT